MEALEKARTIKREKQRIERAPESKRSTKAATTCDQIPAGPPKADVGAREDAQQSHFLHILFLRFNLDAL